MALIQIQKGLTPCQVDDFGDKVERSAKGALYFRPKSTMRLTAGELEHVKEKHPEIAKRLVVIPEKKKVQTPAAPAPAPKPAANPSTSEASSRPSSGTPSGGRSKRRSDG